MEFSDRYFVSCKFGKIEGLVAGVGGDINSGVVWFVSEGLGTGFDVYGYGITLGFDEVIDLGIWYFLEL